MNSTNQTARNALVFIAQKAEYCRTNAEAIGSNVVEAWKIFYFFSGLNLQLLKLRLKL